MAAMMVTWGLALALALLWIAAGYLGRFIDRSIDRNLPDPRWFEA